MELSAAQMVAWAVPEEALVGATIEKEGAASASEAVEEPAAEGPAARRNANKDGTQLCREWGHSRTAHRLLVVKASGPRSTCTSGTVRIVQALPNCKAVMVEEAMAVGMALARKSTYMLLCQCLQQAASTCTCRTPSHQVDCRPYTG